MTFEINCPNCRRTIKAKPEHEGKRFACPGCKRPFLIEKPDQKADSESQEYRLADIGLDAPSPPPLPSRTALDAPPRTAASGYAVDLPESRRYPMLAAIRVVLYVLAGLVVLGWLILLAIALGGIQYVVEQSPEAAAGAATVSGAYLATTFFSGVLTCCMLVAIAELIKVMLDIQANTLAAARR